MRWMMLTLLFACNGPDATTDDGSSDAPTDSVDDDDDTDEGEDTGPDTDNSDDPPAATGLEAYCDYYKECGGTYYETSEDCVEASLNYWGDCPSRRNALDDFGDCMLTIPCSEWNPDVYNPASTDCADEWSDLGASDPC